MGFLERRTFRHAAGSARPGDRYGSRQAHDNGGPSHPLPRPVPPGPDAAPPIVSGPAPEAAPPEITPEVPPGKAVPDSKPRLPDLIELLGRSVLEAHTQEICTAYGLSPRYGAGLSRWYLSRESGLELTADTQGTVTAIMLHFQDDDDFAPYRGEIPGAPGAAPTKDGLRAVLGRPDAAGDSYRDRFLGDFGPWDRWRMRGFLLQAQYALDAMSLHRITLKAPDGATGRVA